MQRKKDFEAMDPRAGQTASAAAQVLRSRSGNPSSIPLRELQPNPDNPRYDYDDPETQDLAETLRTVGQLQAATVIPRENYLAAYPDQHADVGPEPWVVIIGNRRLAASRLAGRSSLDVRVNRELTTSDAIEDLVLVENLQRKDLPPLLEAARLQRRLERPGQSTRTVGQAIGKSHTYVAQRVSLLKLITPLQDLLRTGALDIKTARQLGARCSEEEQRAVLEAGEPYRLPPAPAAKAGTALPADGNLVSGSGVSTSPSATQGTDADIAPAANGQPVPAVNPVSTEAPIDARHEGDAAEEKQAEADADSSFVTPTGSTVGVADGVVTESGQVPVHGAATPAADDVVASGLTSVAGSLHRALVELDRVLPLVPQERQQTIADVRSTVERAVGELGAISK